MPEDWGTQKRTLICSNWRIISSWNLGTNPSWINGNQQDSPDGVTGLAFSGGVDSATALCLMPDSTVLLYHERCALSGKLSHANAHRF